MKQIPILFSLVLAFGFMNAQETYRFRTDAPQGLNIESSTASGLSLHYALQEITLADINYGDDKGQEIVLKGCFGAFAEGLPNLPAENHYIAVPSGAKVSVEVKEKGCKTLNDIDLLPSAPLQMNAEDERPALRWEMSVFGKDTNFPTENVTIAQTTQIRGLDVVLLSVTPFRYNPVRKTLEVVYDMDIVIRFEGGNGQFGDARYRNPAWDNILRDLVINDDMLPEAHYYDFLGKALNNREEGCEYLIIAPDDSAFLAWADTLKQFRLRQGIPTKVVTVTECGGNEPETIRNYILNAYNHWTIPPAAVLLFGGKRHNDNGLGIKTFIFTIPVSQHQTYEFPSDNPYADMNGDSIPDLAISRLPIYTAQDCEMLVKKCIDFELNPPTEPHYYDHPIITSGHEDDKWFMITSQSVNGFYRDKLSKHPTNLYMVYDQMNPNPTPPDSIWSTATNTEAVLDYFGPQGTNYIPTSIGALNDWKSMTDKQLLIDAFNEESFLTLYRDHSSNDSWGSPFFYRSDLTYLQNHHPTFIYSIGCLTNNFWAVCLIEEFLKKGAGAIGGIGSSSVTYSHLNDLLFWGMFDYIWPDFMPSLGSHTAPESVYPSFSLVAGKLFLSQQSFLPYSSMPVQTEKTLNLFNYLGETYLNLYTEVPQPLSVTANAFQREDQPNYTLTADEGSLTCIAKGDEILYLGQGTGQAQTFTLPTMGAGEQFDVTVTKPKHIRFHQKVTIIPSSGSYMLLENYVFRDGNGNDTLEFGETARIDLTLFNAGISVAENTEIQLVCESPYVEIKKGNAVCLRLESNGHTTLHNAFKIKVADNIPDQTEIAFSIILDNGSIVQEIECLYAVCSPSLNITNSFILRTGDQGRTTHILNEGRTEISFQFGNRGHCDSGPIQAKLEVFAPFITVETPPLFIENLPTDSVFTLTFPMETQPNDIGGAWIRMRFTISNGNYEATYEPVVQYGGIFENFETDTLHPFFIWENYPNYPWDYTETDAAEGRRCFESTPPKGKASRLLISTEGYIPEGKMSFYVKTGRYATNGLETLTIEEKTASGNKTQTFSSEDWRYCEANVFEECETLSFQFVMRGNEAFGIRLDDICFPPAHRPIAFAGNDLISCKEAAVELKEAYAYDCDSLFWTTNGDGHFEHDTLVAPIYWPGNQDIANGEVRLTLHAVGTSGSMNSSLKITLLDEILLEGNIIGDSVVDKHSIPISHYSIENQEGLSYAWQLEPATAGCIFDYGNAIEILWNPNDGNTEATLSVTADNGCEITPITKSISLIGNSTPEHRSLSFDLFPNPTEGKVNLVLGENPQGKAIIEVFNLLGERILYQDASHLRQGGTLSLDLSRMVSGLYIIKLSTENGSCSKKVSVR